MKNLRPDQVPYDDQGNMMMHVNEPVAWIDRDTGRMFFPGEDYLVLVHGVGIVTYKDEATRKAIEEGGSAVIPTPVWKPNLPFMAELRKVAKTNGNCTIWVQDRDGHRYPIWYTEWDKIPAGAKRRHTVHGWWVAESRLEGIYGLKWLGTSMP